MSDSHYEWVGAALQNDLAPEHVLFVFSPNPEMLSLHIYSVIIKCLERQNLLEL